MKALWLCVALLGCDATGPSAINRPELIYLIGPADTVGGTATQPAMALRVDPPAEWRRWYRATETCLRLRGDFGRIRWYMVPLPWRGPYGITILAQHGPRMIVIPSVLAGDSLIIEHEAKHDILEHNGLRRASETHDDRFFDRPCLLRGT